MSGKTKIAHDTEALHGGRLGTVLLKSDRSRMEISKTRNVIIKVVWHLGTEVEKSFLDKYIFCITEDARFKMQDQSVKLLWPE